MWALSEMPLIELVKLIFDDIEISCRHPNRQSGHKFLDFLDTIGGIRFGHRGCGPCEVFGTTKHFSAVPHSSVACGCINLVWHPGGWLFDGWWSGPLDSAMNLTPTTMSVWCTPPSPCHRKKSNDVFHLPPSLLMTLRHVCQVRQVLLKSNFIYFYFVLLLLIFDLCL